MNRRTTFACENLEAAIERHEDGLTFSLTDKGGGVTWGPTPLLALEIHDKTLRREDRLERYRVDAVEEVPGGVHVVVGDAARSVSVGLWLRFRDDELSVLLSPPEVYERNPRQYRIFTVDVLPDLLKAGSDGELLLPFGAGSICSPKGKPAVRDRCLIYLEQPRWELGTTLPICGAQSPSAGLGAVAVQGACDALCQVSTDGDDHGRVNFAFSLRRCWPDPVDIENREFRFFPVPAGEALFAAVARRLRRHVVEDLGKKTLRERAAEDPGLAYVLEAYTMKLFYGIENEGAEMTTHDKARPLSFFLAMTFEEAKQGLQWFRDAGVEKIHVKSTGWNPRGHDGLYPTRFPVDERLGGEAGFRDLIGFGHGLGYQMNVHDNFSMNVPHAPNFDPECLIQDVYGEPLVSGWWGGGIEYQTWGLALPPERLELHLARMKDLGLRGMYYCDYMMRPLEVNYHPRWQGPRSHHARGQLRVLNEAKRQFGSVATEYGILPAAVACDYISAGGGGRKGDPAWPVMALMDRVAPVWEMVFSGLTLSEQTGIEWEHAMRGVLFGKHRRDEWSFHVVRHPVLDADRVARVTANYELGVKRFGHLQLEEIVGYEEPNDGVQQTTFADGTEVTADFGKQELFVNGENVACPDAIRTPSRRT